MSQKVGTTESRSSTCRGRKQQQPMRLFLYVDSFSPPGDKAQKNEWDAVIQVDADYLKVKVHTGASTNVLPLRLYKMRCRRVFLSICWVATLVLGENTGELKMACRGPADTSNARSPSRPY